jgi:hypothetical protein
MATERAPTLTVYSRQYCHLCREMIEALRRLQGLAHFEIAVVDVDTDPELERRHGERVPVLTHGEHELCHFHLDTAAVTAYLAKFR